MLIVNQNFIANKNLIPEIFNISLLMLVQTLRLKNIKNKSNFSIYLRRNFVNSVFINPAPESEIQKLLNNLNQSKSLGLNKTPVEIRFKTTLNIFNNISGGTGTTRRTAIYISDFLLIIGQFFLSVFVFFIHTFFLIVRSIHYH